METSVPIAETSLRAPNGLDDSFASLDEQISKLAERLAHLERSQEDLLGTSQLHESPGRIVVTAFQPQTVAQAVPASPNSDYQLLRHPHTATAARSARSQKLARGAATAAAALAGAPDVPPLHLGPSPSCKRTRSRSCKRTAACNVAPGKQVLALQHAVAANPLTEAKRAASPSRSAKRVKQQQQPPSRSPSVSEPASPLLLGAPQSPYHGDGSRAEAFEDEENGLRFSSAVPAPSVGASSHYGTASSVATARTPITPSRAVERYERAAATGGRAASPRIRVLHLERKLQDLQKVKMRILY